MYLDLLTSFSHPDCDFPDVSYDKQFLPEIWTFGEVHCCDWLDYSRPFLTLLQWGSGVSSPYYHMGVGVRVLLRLHLPQGGVVGQCLC